MYIAEYTLSTSHTETKPFAISPIIITLPIQQVQGTAPLMCIKYSLKLLSRYRASYK